MLPERDTELLTGWVDGSLNANERSEAERLLTRSAEARRLLEQLQADAQMLRALPRQPLDEGFAKQVMEKIGERGLVSVHIGGVSRSRAWRRAALAASLLLALAVGSYWYVGRGPVTQRLPEAKTAAGALKDAAVPQMAQIESKDSAGRLAEPPAPSLSSPPPDRPVSGPKGLSDDKSPAHHEQDLVKKERNQESDGIFQVSLEALARPEAKDRLTQQLRQGNAYRIELRCDQNAEAFERLKTAFRANGVEVVAESGQMASKGSRQGADVQLYTEGLTSGEAANILADLGQEAKVGTPRRQALRFQSVAVAPMALAVQQELRGNILQQQAALGGAARSQGKPAASFLRGRQATAEQGGGAVPSAKSANRDQKQRWAVIVPPSNQSALKRLGQNTQAVERLDSAPDAIPILWIVHGDGEQTPGQK
jgi:hypothetical protein